ncbi:hypothetical protein [Priestia megaterium]|uniref:hypothetical protein n=1 Tax=Priestia megaterium TaxID=1404 RepID=UPI000BFA9BB1|nr:hypothetical protein [Priestia megaterium]PFW43761.1 hypothetical protein COL17_26500 [Priestia megaterium]
MIDLNKLTFSEMIQMQDIQNKHEQRMAQIEAEKDQGDTFEIELEMGGMVVRMDEKQFKTVMKVLKEVGED